MWFFLVFTLYTMDKVLWHLPEGESNNGGYYVEHIEDYGLPCECLNQDMRFGSNIVIWKLG